MEARFNTRAASWSLDDIAYGDVPLRHVADDPIFFYMVACASFIEASSTIYINKLVTFFDEEPTVAKWLASIWGEDELQHGAALAHYVQIAWPCFDWQNAYQNFRVDYERSCSLDCTAASRVLEMAGRCVIETSAASFYRMIFIMDNEPILRNLVSRIYRDEIIHYRNFYHYFGHYQIIEKARGFTVVRALWNRIIEVDAEDILYAFKHIYLACNPEATFTNGTFQHFRRDCRRRAVGYFPSRMAAKMLLKPLQLPPAIYSISVPLATWVIGRLLRV